MKIIHHPGRDRAGGDQSVRAHKNSGFVTQPSSAREGLQPVSQALAADSRRAAPDIDLTAAMRLDDRTGSPRAAA